MNKIHTLLKLYGLNANKGKAFRAEANTIYIYDVIVGSDIEAEIFGGVSPKPFIDALKGMSGDVHLRINSPGGDVFGANAMAQAMREYTGGQVIAHIDGVAASAASVLAITAGQTIMAPGALMMIHNAWTIAGGDRHEFLDTASLLEKVDGMLAQAYAAKSGGKPEAFAKMMDAETWFTPEEAVAAGLATSVAEPAPAAQPSASWDLSVFAKAPQAAAPTVIRTTTVTETTEVCTEVETETVEVISGDPAMAPADMTISEIEARKRQHAAAMLRKTA
jgi:ATP-dependent Clp protease protease subunit